MAVKRDIKKARDVVADYLISYVGEKAVAGTPHYDNIKKVWSVPILCYTTRGIFLGGKIELDERLEIIYAPSKSEFTRVNTRNPCLDLAPRLIKIQGNNFADKPRHGRDGKILQFCLDMLNGFVYLSKG